MGGVSGSCKLEQVVRCRAENSRGDEITNLRWNKDDEDATASSAFCRHFHDIKLRRAILLRVLHRKSAF